MQFENNTTTTETSGGVEAKPLQIHNIADMKVISRILTDSLYSDPERTVLAEYASNAWDAHVKAGNTDTPIEITLPSKWGSHDLVFVDHGTGMSNEDADHYCGGIGASSKRENNEEIGGFGLGFKSAYAIDGVDGFTVVTVKDGKRTIVSMTKGEDGLPAIATFPAQDTDEENGTTITIPIPIESIDILNSKVAEHFATWEPGRVLVDGVEPPSIYNSGEFHQVGEFGWISREKSSSANYSSTSSLNVISGGNAYKITLTGKDIHEICGSYAYLATGYNPFTVYLNTAIGEVDLSANRADVRLKRSTREVLKARYKQFADTLVAEVQDKMSAATNEAEALIAARSITKYVRANDITWRDQIVPSEVQIRGAGYTYEDGKRSRSYGTTGERSTISLPVNVSAESSTRISKFYLMDTTGIPTTDATILGHLTTYIKMDDFDGPNRFRVYFTDPEGRNNPWVQGAIQNGTISVLSAADVIEASKEERKRNRVRNGGTGARETMTYPYLAKEDGRMVLREVPMAELKEIVDDCAGEVILLSEQKWGGPSADTVIRHSRFFGDDDVVLISKVNRKEETLIKRAGLTSYQRISAYMGKVVDDQVAAASETNEELYGRIVKNNSVLRSILKDMGRHAEAEGIEILDSKMKSLVNAASTFGYNEGNENLATVAAAFEARSGKLESYNETRNQSYNTALAELTEEQPLLMTLADRWGWNSVGVADLVTLVNAKA